MILRRPVLDLDDAVVVLTGASSGIGRATALRLAGRGARLVLAARSAEALEQTRTAVTERGADAIAVPTDVSDEASVARLAQAAEGRFGRIDAWISNAGVMAYGRFDEVPVATHRQVIQTNLLGPMYGAAHAIERFRRQGRGVLVNVSSLYGEMTTPFVSSYVTSKFGLLGFSRVLRRDLRPDRDIAVCCVLPSSIDTPIFRTAANYRGRRVRALPPVADPDRVAQVVIHCLQHPRSEVRVGYLGRFFALGEKLVPPVYDRVVNRAFDVLGFTGEAQDAHDGNVFRPDLSWQQVSGEWRNTTARRVIMVVAASAAIAAAVVSVRAR